MMWRNKTIATLLLTLLTVGVGTAASGRAWSVSAHSEGGTIEEKVDAFLVDIGYEPAPLITNQESVFDFALYNLVRGEAPAEPQRQPAPYDSLWVKLSQGDRVMVATGVDVPQFGKPSLLYTFTSPGEYTLDVRFLRRNQTVAELTKTIQVGQGSAAAAGATARAVSATGLPAPRFSQLVLTIMALVAGTVVGGAASAIFFLSRQALHEESAPAPVPPLPKATRRSRKS